MRRPEKSLRQRWGSPIALAVTTGSGLLFALVGDSDVWRALSWLALSVPLLVTLKCWLLPRRLTRRSHA